jgi:hypothetical protein
MDISFLKKKRFSPFERRFPYLLLWNFSDCTGWKILRGAWNAWHKNSGCRVSVSSLYISPLWLYWPLVMLLYLSVDKSIRKLLIGRGTTTTIQAEFRSKCRSSACIFQVVVSLSIFRVEIHICFYYTTRIGKLPWFHLKIYYSFMFLIHRF